MQHVHKNPSTGEEHSVKFTLSGFEITPSSGVMYSNFSPRHRLQIGIGSRQMNLIMGLAGSGVEVNFQIIAYVDGEPMKIEDVDVIVESVKAETIMAHTGIVMTVTLKEIENKGE